MNAFALTGRGLRLPVYPGRCPGLCACWPFRPLLCPWAGSFQALQAVVMPRAGSFQAFQAAVMSWAVCLLAFEAAVIPWAVCLLAFQVVVMSCALCMLAFQVVVVSRAVCMLAFQIVFAELVKVELFEHTLLRLRQGHCTWFWRCCALYRNVLVGGNFFTAVLHRDYRLWIGVMYDDPCPQPVVSVLCGIMCV